MAKNKQHLVTISQRLYEIAMADAEIWNKCYDERMPNQLHKSVGWQDIIRWSLLVQLVTTRQSTGCRFGICPEGYSDKGGYPHKYCKECKKVPAQVFEENKK